VGASEIVSSITSTSAEKLKTKADIKVNTMITAPDIMTGID
jgi:molybdopterin-binding protein